MNAETVALILAFVLGSNGLIMTWTRIYQRKSEADAGAKIKQLEIQLVKAKDASRKTASDEHQTDELIVSQRQLLYMLGQEQSARKEVEKQNEQNYGALKGISDRNNQETREYLDKRMNDMQTFVTGFVEQTVATLQAQYAAYDVYKEMKAVFPVAPEHDCNWKRYTIHFTHAPRIRILKAPLHLNDEIAGTILPGDEVYGIEELHRPEAAHWMQVRLLDMPEVSGWIELWNVRIEIVTSVN